MKRLFLCSLLLTFAMLSEVDAQFSEHEDVQVINPSATQPTTLGKADVAKASSMIVDKTNAFRQQQGMSTVKRNKNLEKAASDFASYMAKKDRYGHTADGRRPSQRAKQAGYEYCIVLENIAYQYRTSDYPTQELAQQFVQGWKDSPGHRKNMLDPDITETGVAIAQSKESGYYYAVQLFGRPKSNDIEFSLENNSATTIDYKVGDREFKLPPRYRRTHTVCRPPEVMLTSKDTKTPELKKKIQPADGSRYVIKKSTDGKVQVEKQ